MCLLIKIRANRTDSSQSTAQLKSGLTLKSRAAFIKEAFAATCAFKDGLPQQRKKLEECEREIAHQALQLNYVVSKKNLKKKSIPVMGRKS